MDDAWIPVIAGATGGLLGLAGAWSTVLLGNRHQQRQHVIRLTAE